MSESFLSERDSDTNVFQRIFGNFLRTASLTEHLGVTSSVILYTLEVRLLFWLF